MSFVKARLAAPRLLPPRSTARTILLAAALLAIPLMVLSALDTGGLRALWDNLNWTGTSILGAVATALSIRGSVGRARTVRIVGAAVFLVWTVATLLGAYLILVGQATIPSFADVLVLTSLGTGLLLIVATVRRRLSRAEEAAVYLDSAMIFCLLATVMILGHGSVAIHLPSAAGLIALAYPTAFIGLAAGGFAALVAVRHPIAPRGAFAIIGGCAALGFAYLGWVAPTVERVAAGELPSILFSVGTLLIAYGVITWDERDDELDNDAGYARTSRFISRAIGPTVAGLTFLALLPQVDPGIEMLVDGAVFVTGALFVIRQALLLRERTTMLDEVTRLKLDNDRLVDELRDELEEHAFDQRRMIQASRAAAVGELAAGVAHEVNNPLAAVLGYAELLIDDIEPNDPRRADVETIRTQALRARSIVRALGDFAQRGAPALAPTDLGDLVRRTVDLIRFQAERRGVTVEERYGPLPDVLVDAQSIQQAVINVLTNATQAVADGGRIEVEASNTGSVVTIVVIDDGVGMTDTTVDRAFEPFFTGRARESDQTLPTGLGLAVSRGLIEAHSGTITLSSRPGEGTRVELRLPVDQAAVANDRNGLGGEVQ